MKPSETHQPTSVRCRAVVIGGSAGGLEALAEILGPLPAAFALPLLVVQHLHAGDGGRFAVHLCGMTALPVVEPCDKEAILPGHVYTAPANYHMLVERAGQIALSVDERVNWSRPSIDVLFESAARAYGKGLAAVILSGANSDGAEGMRAVKALGGLAVAQDPASAEYPVMPRAAIDAARMDHVLSPQGIADLLCTLGPLGDQGAKDRINAAKGKAP